MKTIFVEAKSKLDITLPKPSIDLLPTRIGLLTTIQHVHKIAAVKKALEEQGKKVTLIKGSRSKHAGQILGCDVMEISPANVDAFLFIGTGEFHPKELLISQKKPVYVYNPSSGKFYQLKAEDISQTLRRQKGAYLKFLSSKNIGVIISTKPGQSNLKSALKLKQRYKDKSFYFLLFDTIDFSSLLNFPFIECIINTACPRIGYDDQLNIEKPILNIDDLPKMRKR